MNSHIEFKTIHGESWIMHRDNVKAITVVDTPDQFIEEYKHEKVVMVTSTEVNEKDGKPWQFMVSNTYQSILKILT